MLGKPEAANWRSCSADKALETRATDDFRSAFADFCDVKVFGTRTKDHENGDVETDKETTNTTIEETKKETTTTVETEKETTTTKGETAQGDGETTTTTGENTKGDGETTTTTTEEDAEGKVKRQRRRRRPTEETSEPKETGSEPWNELWDPTERRRSVARRCRVSNDPVGRCQCSAPKRLTVSRAIVRSEDRKSVV